MSLNFLVKPGGKLSGSFKVPGDKSISHRAVILGSLAEGVTEIHGFLAAEDTLATANALRNLGVQIDTPSAEHLIVHGVGMAGLRPVQQELDLGNSGTGIRLLAGVLAAQKFDSTLIGDESLMKRPMQRIANPLVEMGAKISLLNDKTAPIKIAGNQNLHGINYQLPMASAQVKSCVLLAGLFAKNETVVTEPAPTRDHTERLLRDFSVDISSKGATCRLNPPQKLMAHDVVVPADISAAAFFMVGASIAPNSDILLKDVGINPTRCGVINILSLMGADITIENERGDNEPIADIRVRFANLRGIEIPLDQVPLAIDEFPAIFIAAACAQGETYLRGAKELRLKESDRIQVMSEGLAILGIEAEALPDGIRICGGKFGGGRINSFGDHRIAMSFAIAGLVANKEIYIDDCANVATSFPNFVTLAHDAGLNITIE